MAPAPVLVYRKTLLRTKEYLRSPGVVDDFIGPVNPSLLGIIHFPLFVIIAIDIVLSINPFYIVIIGFNCVIAKIFSFVRNVLFGIVKLLPVKLHEPLIERQPYHPALIDRDVV